MVNSGDDPAEQEKVHYDLIVVGAGIAGLNALHAASQYLPQSARVLLIDAKDRPGGMWTMAYDYVRLHQPHPLFTVGGLRWNWRKPAHYLAARDDVQRHLDTCFGMSRDRFDLEERFAHFASDVREISRAGQWIAEVDVHPVGKPFETTTVQADRVIHASGFDYEAPEPIGLSGQNVLSIAPADVASALTANPTSAVYVVGGGKTGMDTIMAILNASPTRKVTLINGNGTYYMNRDRLFPSGIRRWTSGTLAARVFRECAMIFDGTNEGKSRAHFLANYAVSSDPRNQNFIYGLLSEDENARIEAGLQDKLWDYLQDVEDRQAGPVMRMRSGAEIPVEKGSIFVNCTGSIFRKGSQKDRMPCLSPNERILSINTHHAAHILTTYSSFILAHLFFAGTLRKAGLYFLDLDALLGKDKQAFAAATFAQSYHNLLMGLKNLSPSARKHFGMDFNRWYPRPRRFFALLAIRKTAREDILHCRRALDVVVKRFELPGGPLK